MYHLRLSVLLVMSTACAQVTIDDEQVMDEETVAKAVVVTDGCGAGLHEAEVPQLCNYPATYNPTSYVGVESSQCFGNQVICHYSLQDSDGFGRACTYNTPWSSPNACISGEPACRPTTSIPQTPRKTSTLDLPTGNTLCDPDQGDWARERYCAANVPAGLLDQLRQRCTDESFTDDQSRMVACCVAD